MTQPFTGYLTNKALTDGIKIVTLELLELPEHDTVAVDQKTMIAYSGEGVNWHRSYGSALRRAQDMRDAEVLRLRAQADILAALTFPAMPAL